MKLAFLSGIGEWIKKHKILTTAIIVLLVCGIGAGGFFGFKQYERRQSSEYALEQLKMALNPPNPNKLAHLVDFRKLGSDLAKAASEVFPFMHAGADQERVISQLAQTALLKNLVADKKGSQFPEDESEEAQLRKELKLLPMDLVEQLVANASLKQTGQDTAMIVTKVDNKQLKDTFELRIALRHYPDGWIATKLVNARELAEQLRADLLKRHAGLREVYLEKNAKATKEMNAMLPLKVCEADAGLLSDGKTFMMVIHVNAKNEGKSQINNYNLDTAIYGKSGKLLLRRFLNASKATPPGSSFDNRWTFELDASDPLAQEILRDGPLECRAQWQTLSLSAARVIHIAEVPNPDQNCERPGHDHPYGFCSLPIFQR